VLPGLRQPLSYLDAHMLALPIEGSYPFPVS
jgi:hypothetical protein